MFVYSDNIKSKSLRCKYFSYVILVILMYMYILSIINTILKHDLYTYFINRSFNSNSAKQTFSYNEISGYSNKNYSCKLLLINDFLNLIEEIKILLSCFDILYINLKYIPVYKQGLYYGVSSTYKGSVFIPSNSGLGIEKSNLFKIFNEDYEMLNKNIKLNFGFPEIKYSNNVSYSPKTKTIRIKNMQGIETDKIVLSNLNRYEAVDIIQKTIFIILNCIVYKE